MKVVIPRYSVLLAGDRDESERVLRTMGLTRGFVFMETSGRYTRWIVEDYPPDLRCVAELVCWREVDPRTLPAVET